MNKRIVNGFSPSSGIFSKTKPRRSIKENLVRRSSRNLTVNESSRVLQVNLMNRDPNNEIFIEDKSEHACKAQTLVAASSVFETCKNLEKIKESIRDIRNEGIVVNLEVQKLNQQLEYGSSCRESSRSKRSLMDSHESSKELNNLGIQNEILELKNQVQCLNQRLCKGEELIKSKAVENYSLQFQAFNLTKKLQKVRSKREAIENTKCSICEIF